jgi:steroid delta-isomerase-like uncharacterized protein
MSTTQSEATSAIQASAVSIEDKKALARLYYEQVWSRGNTSILSEIIAPQYIHHDPPFPQEARGREGAERIVALYRGAFPDLTIPVDGLIAESDLVVVRWTARGTHLGALMEMSPTGKTIQVSGVEVLRIVDGRIVEEWTNWDQLGLLRQLGAVPLP